MKNLKPRGTKDLVGNEYIKQKAVINVINDLAFLYDFKYLETPIFEYLEVFKKTLGESSDVVKKEMFCFTDKKKRQYVLRPEATASIMRYMTESKLINSQNLPKSIYTIGPMFRYERPQTGRQRQFMQASFETFSTKRIVFDDFMLIKLACKILDNLKIDDYIVKINNLASLATRVKYIKELKTFFKLNQAKLSDLSKERLKTNPLRILDSKEEKDLNLLKTTPKINKFYTKDEEKELLEIKKYLIKSKINFEIDSNLVRGLDYYEGIVFEIIPNTNKKSMGTLIAGGRYDELSKIFDNKKISCLGFAVGIERIVKVLNDEFVTNLLLNDRKKLLLVPLTRDIALNLLDTINSNNFISIDTKNFDIKKSYKYAQSNDFRYVGIVGKKEILTKEIKIKDLKNNSETIKKLKKNKDGSIIIKY